LAGEGSAATRERCGRGQALGQALGLLYLSTDTEFPSDKPASCIEEKKIGKVWKCKLFNQTISNLSTVELHLSELIGTSSHLDMQKIQIIGFFKRATSVV
jgi:hypothetical protein